MHAVTAIGLALSVAGCDRAFGLSRDVDAGADAEADAAPNVVTGSFKQKYVANDQTFAPMPGERIFEPSAVDFAVTLDDGSKPAIEYRPDGAFSFETPIPGQAYRISITFEGTRLEFQHTAQHLTLASLTAGHPVRQPVGVTSIQFPYPPVATATSGARITSTGIYTSTESGLYGPTVTFDWRLALPASGALPGLLDAAQHDRVYAIEYITDSTTLPTAPPYLSIRAVSSASVTQVLNGTTVLPMPTPMPRNTCARIIATNAVEHARIVAAHPQTYVLSSADWNVFATPAPDWVGIGGASWLAVSGQSPAVNLNIAPTFHDPYIGMTLIAEAAAAASFNVTLPTGTPLQLPNITRIYQRVDRGNPAACSPAPVTLSPTVGIPGGFTLEDIPLAADGQVVELDLTRDLRLGWSLAAPGPVDFYQYTLQELVVVAGATTSVLRTTGLIGGQSFALVDSSLLIPGHFYVFAIIAHRSRPAAATGDFVTLALPFENTTLWSRYFEVRAK